MLVTERSQRVVEIGLRLTLRRVALLLAAAEELELRFCLVGLALAVVQTFLSSEGILERLGASAHS